MRWELMLDPVISGQLCLTLLHSLWLVTLLTAFAWIVDRLVGRRAVERSYAIHVVALVASMLALPATYWTVAAQGVAPPVEVGVAADVAPVAVPPPAPEPLAAESPDAMPPGVDHAVETASAAIVPVTPQPEEVAAAPLSPGPGLWATFAPWLAGFYAAGVVAMLFRLALGMWRAQQLGARAEVLRDGPLVDMLRSIADQWSMRVVPTLARAERIVTPKVIGLLRPTILLPTSAITGLAPEELELILAHELAHVRRFDMWLNLLQRLAETVLFFNPALWYLSRRVSLLREYCCDEVVCGGSPGSGCEPHVRYAQALLRVVEVAGVGRDQAELASLAASGRSPSELRRRVARLFGEPLAESIRFSRGGAILTGVLAALLLVGPIVRQSADAGRQEEVDVEEPLTDETGTAKISGKIVLEDGSPATQEGWLYSIATVDTIAVSRTSSKTEGQFTDRFSIEAPAGEIVLKYFADGFAPAWHGPIRVRSGTTLEDVTLVLTRGYSVPLSIVNEQDEPIADATFCTYPQLGDHFGGGPRVEESVDSQGKYLLEHLADTPYRFQVSAAGYETLRTEPRHLKANTPTVLKMRRSIPTTGVVLNADGTPAKGANLCQHYGQPTDGHGGSLGLGEVMATTDSEGRFTLDRVVRGWWYAFVVETADHARVVVPLIRAGERDVRVTVPPRRDLHVQVMGDLTGLPKRQGKPCVRVRQRVAYGAREVNMTVGDLIRGEAFVTPNDAGGTGEYQGLVAGSVEVSIGDETKTVDVVDDGVTEVVFHLSKSIPDGTRVQVQDDLQGEYRWQGDDFVLAPGAAGAISTGSSTTEDASKADALAEKDTRYEEILHRYWTARKEQERIIAEKRKSDPAFARAMDWCETEGNGLKWSNLDLEQEFLATNPDKEKQYYQWKASFRAARDKEIFDREWKDHPAARPVLLEYTEGVVKKARDQAQKRDSEDGAEIPELQGTDAERWNQAQVFLASRFDDAVVDGDVEELARQAGVSQELKDCVRKWHDGVYSLIFAYLNYRKAHMPPENKALNRERLNAAHLLNALYPGWHVEEGIELTNQEKRYGPYGAYGGEMGSAKAGMSETGSAIAAPPPAAGASKSDAHAPSPHVDMRTVVARHALLLDADGKIRQEMILARVGTQQILASDILPAVNEALSKLESIDRATEDEIAEARETLVRRMLPQLIDQKMLYVDARRNLPEEALDDIRRRLEEGFEETEIPRRLEKLDLHSRLEFELQLAKWGSSLEHEKRAFIEKTIARQWLRETLRDVPKEQGPEQVRNLLERLRKEIPVWTIFDPQGADRSHNPSEKASEKVATAEGKTEGAKAAPVEAEKSEQITAPITVSGRALDQDGKPIAGAEIFLASTRSDCKVLAVMESDRDGSYRFEEVPLPIERSDKVGSQATGAFEVFGRARGYSFTWRPLKWFYPDSVHVDGMVDDPTWDLPHKYGRDDPIELDLTLGPPMSLRGRLVNDLGEPIAGAEPVIRDGDKWSDWDSRSLHDLESFNQRLVPESVRLRHTDEDGRFEFTDLPADRVFSIDIEPPGYAKKYIHAVTREGVHEDSEGNRVYSGDMEIVFERPRRSQLRVVYSDTGEPAEKVSVGGGNRTASFSETTDTDGLVDVALPDGKYTLGIMPRYNTPYLRTTTEITVSEESVKQPVTVELDPAAVVDISVIDADSGKPLAGADVWLERRSSGSAKPSRRVHGYRSWEVVTRISHYTSPRSDASGKMRVLFEPGKHRIGIGLETYPKGYVPVEVDGQEIECQVGKPTSVVFHMRKAGTPSDESPAASGPTSAEQFALRIVDPDAKPVPGALVEIRTSPVPTAEQILQGEFVKKSTYGSFAKADENGRLLVSLPKKPDRLNFSIKTPGYGPYWAACQVDGDRQTVPNEFTAELDPAWSVGGIVVDEDGQPVEGVEVHPSIEYKKRPGDNQQLGMGERFKTDAQGVWRFDCVPVSMDKVFVEIDHPDFMPKRQSLPRAEFEVKPGEAAAGRIVLSPGLTVSGKVTDDAGLPVEGALLRAKFGNDIRQAKTDAQGRYNLVGCEPRLAKIVVSAKGRATDMQEVQIKPQMEPVDFEMQPGGTVRIRVLDENDNPIPKARILFQRWRGWWQMFEFGDENQYTDAAGVWQWNEAPLDEFQADIWRPDGMQSRLKLIARDEEYVVHPPAALVITGTVVDADTKEPIKNFQAIPGSRSNDSRPSWQRSESDTSTDGNYRLRHDYSYPTHVVRIEAEGYLAAVSRDIRNDEGNVTVNFELKKGQDVAATIHTPDGKPAAGADVALGIAGSQIMVKNGEFTSQTYASRATANSSGAIRFPAQSSDFELVAIHTTGFARLRIPAAAPPETIDLTPWARVEGTFRIGQNPAADIRLSLSLPGHNSYGNDLPSISFYHETTTGNDGAYAFERVIPGKGRIGRDMQLMADSGSQEKLSSSMLPIEIPPGETVRFDFGGTGRTVIGKLVPPDGYTERVLWNFASVNIETGPERPEPPVDFGNNDPFGSDPKWAKWHQSPEGKAYSAAVVQWIKSRKARPSIRATVGPDASFRLDDLPAGECSLSVSFNRESPGQLQDYRFEIPESDPASPDPIDLGVLKLEPSR